MDKKISQKPTATEPSKAHMAESVKESAQQIWQAGLGAFTRAQAEGSKAFEALVKEGVAIQRKTQALAEDRLSEATNKMSTMATDITSKATGQWDKLENIFEDRVAKALGKLGVPSSADIQALNDRFDTLHQSVQKLCAKAPAKKPATATATAKSSAKTSIKPTTRTTSKPAAPRAR